MPKCAIAVPQAERGNPAARRSAAPSGTRRIMVRSTISVSAPAMTKSASPTPNGASTGPPCWTANVAAIATAATKRGSGQALRDAVEIAALPRQAAARTASPAAAAANSGPKVRIEERRPDRNLRAGQRFERERIERADENGGAGGGQKQIVEHQRAFARDRREQTALLQQRRAPGDRAPAPPPMNSDEDGQDEDAAPRIDREGVHRGEHARAHQERADQRQREGEDRQQDGPDLERAALLHHHGGMQQRRADQPGHQRSVLDRVPEPPAAPAELVIGPIRAHRRCRASGTSRRRAPTAAPSAPRPRRCGPRSSAAIANENAIEKPT